MKTTDRTLRIVFALVLLLLAGKSSAQSLSLSTIPGSHFCAGDPITFSFTATGSWMHKNAFTVQLSDTGGSFSNGVFTNIGSLADTVPGNVTIVATLPARLNYSSHYRFRVIGSNPYTVSADNGIDISIGSADHHQFEQFTAWTINSPITFKLFDTNLVRLRQVDTIYWNFDSGANPASAIDTINDIPAQGRHTTTYSASGLKTVVARSISPGGCAATDTLLTYVFDCSLRSIPHNAHVISEDVDLDAPGTNSPIRSNSNLWVNPGVTLTGGEFDTIYAEAGSTIGDGPGNIVFLKPGASYTGRTASVVIYAEGASVNPNYAGGATLKCSSLYDFDYTNAPPNSAFPASVRDGLKFTSIALSPNPTHGMLSIQDLPESAEISVINLLGETVLQQANLRSPNVTLDLSKFVPGAYYIRIASANSVITKKVVRE